MICRLKEGATVDALANTIARLSLEIAKISAKLTAKGVLTKDELFPILEKMYATANDHFQSDDPDLGKLIP